MSAAADVVAVARQWMARADEDLLAVELLLATKDQCPTATTCFHAQQAVEKYLKALLALKGIPFPKTHDLGELQALVPAGIPPLLEPRMQEVLTRYAVVVRYPGFDGPPSMQEAMAARDAARHVSNIVSPFISEPKH